MIYNCLLFSFVWFLLYLSVLFLVCFYSCETIVWWNLRLSHNTSNKCERWNAKRRPVTESEGKFGRFLWTHICTCTHTYIYVSTLEWKHGPSTCSIHASKGTNTHTPFPSLSLRWSVFHTTEVRVLWVEQESPVRCGCTDIIVPPGNSWTNMHLFPMKSEEMFHTHMYTHSASGRRSSRERRPGCPGMWLWWIN